MLTRFSLDVALAMFGIIASSLSAGAQSAATRTLVLGATFEPRSSLQVATSHLQFDVAEDGRVEDAVVGYRVAARTRQDGGVSLTVEPDEAPGTAGGAGLIVQCRVADGEPALATGRPQVVARWRGSGVREGAMRCSLERAAAPGHYSLHVRFAVVMD